ncbi:MAG: DUF92 domain-containing protein [Chloroflexi bacterium]|nr:DUF92 domain-containing protein [Chloroflexota bacterium]
MSTLVQLFIGIVLSLAISVLAYMRNSLSESGVIGAVVVGTIIFGLGEWHWGFLLITFFILSSLLSSYKKTQKEQTAAEKFDKGSRRDFGQVMANAGLGALLALLWAFSPWRASPALLGAFIGAMATVNADTWATELGVLAKQPPRLITTFKPVEVGTSGGVTIAGTLAALSGAVVIGGAMMLFEATYHFVTPALAGWLARPAGGFQIVGSFNDWGLVFVSLNWMLLAAGIGGLVGSMFDSLLGATVQAIYYSKGREKETEKVIDPDGTPNTLLRGWKWLNNDWVNFISSIVGAVTAAGLTALVL